MRLLRAEVGAFMRLRPFTLDYSRPGLVQVIGENLDRGGTADRSNMSGKSLALVEVLPWCLYGKMVRYGDRNCKAEAQHAAHGAAVRTWIEDAGHTYAIDRLAPLKGSTRFQALRLLTDAERAGSPDPSAATALTPVPLSRDLRRRVDEASELLGLDYPTFRYAFAIRSADSFPAGTFAQQMATLEALLRLTDLSEAAEVARTRAATATQRGQVHDAEVQGAERQVQALRQALDTVSQETEVAERLERIDDLRAVIKDLEQVAGQAGPMEEVLAGMRTTLAHHERQVWDAQARLQVLAREHQQARGQVQAEACPTCQRKFPNAKAVAEHNARVAADLDRIETENREQTKIQTKARQAIQGQTAKIRATEEELRRLQRVGADLAGAQVELAAQEQWLRERDARRAALAEQITAAEGAVTQAQQRRAAEAQVAARYGFWGPGFGRDGLQAHIFAEAVPVLNRAAQHAAAVLTEGQIEVTFTPHRGSQREDLLKIRGASAPTFEGCSGGEQDRLTLICAWALRALARWRLAEPFNVAVYDEVFDRIDPAGLRAIVDFLVEEAKTARVFVITHNDGLKAHLPFTSTIKVTRSGGEATVEEIL